MTSTALARILIRPPTRPSQSAVSLRNSINGTRLSRERVGRQYRYVLNWGNSSPLQVRSGVQVINPPESVANAIDKVKAFQLWSQLSAVNIPAFYVNTPPESFDGILLARTDPSASAGRGIVVCRAGDTVPAAPLYVEYIPKLVEYRVHVVNGKAIFVQQKLRSSEAEQDKDQKLIRSYANGWVFCPRNLEDISEEVKNASVMAVNGLGLHFGAIDLVIHRDNNKPYLLECNTAPGISSPTLLAAYKEAFEQWLT